MLGYCNQNLNQEKNLQFSLIIPAYNEENRITKTLGDVTAYLAQQKYSWEIIVVDDGSRDGTASKVRTEFPQVTIIENKPNRGKGHAVKTGMFSANGDVRVFFDADGSTPIEEMDKFWPLFDNGADLVIGSRALPQSSILIRQPWYRETMGKVFNLFVKMVLLRDFPDTQCGFKGFTAQASELVFSKQTMDGFSFDAEILFIAKREKLKIAQVPVRWFNSPATRVHPLIDSSKMLLDLLVMRLKALRGIYK